MSLREAKLTAEEGAGAYFLYQFDKGLGEGGGELNACLLLARYAAGGGRRGGGVRWRSVWGGSSMIVGGLYPTSMIVGGLYPMTVGDFYTEAPALPNKELRSSPPPLSSSSSGRLFSVILTTGFLVPEKSQTGRAERTDVY